MQAVKRPLQALAPAPQHRHVDVAVNVVRLQRSPGIGSEEAKLGDEVQWPPARHDTAQQVLDQLGRTVAFHRRTVPQPATLKSSMSSSAPAGPAAQEIRPPSCPVSVWAARGCGPEQAGCWVD